jgi:hypothetical protein
LFLLDASPIGFEAIDIPVPGRREVELPIVIRILHTEKELEAGFFPESVLAHARVCRRRNHKFHQRAVECITEGEHIGTPADVACDL